MRAFKFTESASTNTGESIHNGNSEAWAIEDAITHYTRYIQYDISGAYDQAMLSKRKFDGSMQYISAKHAVEEVCAAIRESFGLVEN